MTKPRVGPPPPHVRAEQILFWQRDWRDDKWYFTNDVVKSSGLLWRLKVAADKGTQPPTLATTASAHWEFYARADNSVGGGGGGSMTGAEIEAELDSYYGNDDWRSITPTNLTSSRTASTNVIHSDTGTDATLSAVSDTEAGLMLPAQKTKLDGIEDSADVNVGTDLSISGHGATGLNINSNTGTDVALALATSESGTNRAGLFSPGEKDKLAGIEAGAEVNDPTNLSIANKTSTTLDVASSTGTDATVPAATTADAGLMSAADKAKLDGIEAGADNNVATDLSLANRDDDSWDILSSTGTDVSLTGATTSLAGLMTGTDKTKLNGIESGATADLTGAEIVALIDAELGSDDWQEAGGGGGYSDEQAQDAVGTILADSSTIDFTYTDATPEITAAVKAASISLSHWAAGILDTDDTLAADSDTRVPSQQAVKAYVDTAIAGVPGSTNLSVTNLTATSLDVASDTGTDATIPLATSAGGTNKAGLMSPGEKDKLAGIESGAQVNVATNLSLANHDDNSIDVLSSTGTDVTLPAATPTSGTNLAGLMTAADKEKLDGIEASADVNVGTDLSLANRDGDSWDIQSSTGNDVSLTQATTTLAGLFSAADKTKIDSITTFGFSLIDDIDAAAARTTLGLVIGTNVQAYDAELAALAGLTSAADKLPYWTGAGTAANADFTTFGRSLIDDADAAAARATLDIEGADIVSYINTELGGTTWQGGSGGGGGGVSRPQGRLTLQSGVPVMVSTQSAKTTVYYSPYQGRGVPLYNGTSFSMVDIGGELSQATSDTTKSPAAVASEACYDVFVWDDSGTKRATRGPAWSYASTVTMTIASPAVISWTGHGLTEGTPVVFTTTGALPTGITSGTVYYVGRSPGANSFNVSTTVANAAAGTFVNTTGSQSGTHTCTSRVTSRGTGSGTSELTYVEGIALNAQSITNGPAASRGTYVGTIRSNSSSQIDWILGGSGQAAFLNVWNMYNRVQVSTVARETASSWTYTTNTLRGANGTQNSRVWWVAGLAEDYVDACYITNVEVRVQSNGCSSITENGSALVSLGRGSSNTTAAEAIASTQSTLSHNTGGQFWAPPALAGGRYRMVHNVAAALVGYMGAQFVQGLEQCTANTIYVSNASGMRFVGRF